GADAAQGSGADAPAELSGRLPHAGDPLPGRPQVEAASEPESVPGYPDDGPGAGGIMGDETLRQPVEGHSRALASGTRSQRYHTALRRTAQPGCTGRLHGSTRSQVRPTQPVSGRNVGRSENSPNAD